MNSSGSDQRDKQMKRYRLHHICITAIVFITIAVSCGRKKQKESTVQKITKQNIEFPFTFTEIDYVGRTLGQIQDLYSGLKLTANERKETFTVDKAIHTFVKAKFVLQAGRCLRERGVYLDRWKSVEISECVRFYFEENDSQSKCIGIEFWSPMLFLYSNRVVGNAVKLKDVIKLEYSLFKNAQVSWTEGVFAGETSNVGRADMYYSSGNLLVNIVTLGTPKDYSVLHLKESYVQDVWIIEKSALD